MLKRLKNGIKHTFKVFIAGLFIVAGILVFETHMVYGIMLTTAGTAFSMYLGIKFIKNFDKFIENVFEAPAKRRAKRKQVRIDKKRAKFAKEKEFVAISILLEDQSKEIIRTKYGSDKRFADVRFREQRFERRLAKKTQRKQKKTKTKKLVIKKK